MSERETDELVFIKNFCPSKCYFKNEKISYRLDKLFIAHNFDIGLYPEYKKNSYKLTLKNEPRKN